MPEIQLGAHTLRSHGVQVAKIHMHDWLILFLLVVIDIILNVIEPFHRFVGKGMMEDFMYPLKGNTVPFWAVPMIAILLPFCVILIYYFIRKDVYDFHQATLGSFAGLTFLAWYLSGKIRCFDRRGHIAKLCLIFLPILLAAMVGVSRVDDYWHHWQDVFAGGLIGLVISSFCYLQFFPPPYDPDGWGPHSYFHMLEESRNGVQHQRTNAGALSVRATEIEGIQIEPRHGSDGSEFQHYQRNDREGGMS